ncbi:MAG: hypothetical protein K0S65_5995 [Labilithrix sp.]|nr:hypothetical protein [Labilithrix sp.]
MEPRTIAPRPDVALANTSPRVTPTPPRASRFGEVLSNTVVRSAESAMRVLPGSPMMAVAVRGATGSPGSIGVPMNTMSATSPQGPTVGSPRYGYNGPTANLAGAAVPGASGAVPGTSGGVGEAGSLEASLQQSQDMNLYFLQIQESVNAQNRSFTALSNVLKAEHDTVKTAIGNIR